jgi:hypothetical protein
MEKLLKDAPVTEDSASIVVVLSEREARAVSNASDLLIDFVGGARHAPAALLAGQGKLVVALGIVELERMNHGSDFDAGGGEGRW